MGTSQIGQPNLVLTHTNDISKKYEESWTRIHLFWKISVIPKDVNGYTYSTCLLYLFFSLLCYSTFDFFHVMDAPFLLFHAFFLPPFFLSSLLLVLDLPCGGYFTAHTEQSIKTPVGRLDGYASLPLQSHLDYTTTLQRDKIGCFI